MYKSESTLRFEQEREAALPGELMAMITNEPGRAKSYYIDRPVSKGGLRGLQSAKRTAFRQLVREKLIVKGPNRGVRRDVKGYYPAGHPGAKESVRRLSVDIELEVEMVGFISRNPGQTRSYYCRLPRAQGGIKGSQERKERVLDKLLAEKAVFLWELHTPRGRCRFVVYSPGQKPAEPATRCVLSKTKQASVWVREKGLDACVSTALRTKDSELELALLRLIEQEPYRGQSYYCRLPVAEGGLRGSQERKERAFERLLADGRAARHELDAPYGRCKFVIYLPGQKPKVAATQCAERRPEVA